MIYQIRWKISVPSNECMHHKNIVFEFRAKVIGSSSFYAIPASDVIDNSHCEYNNTAQIG